MKYAFLIISVYSLCVLIIKIYNKLRVNCLTVDDYELDKSLICQTTYDKIIIIIRYVITFDLGFLIMSTIITT
jgi:hypothetical protein